MPSLINECIVKEFNNKFGSEDNMVFIDCSRLNSEETFAFRKKLSAENTRLKVVTNRLLKTALKDNDRSGVADFCKGQTAVVFGEDPVAVTKNVVNIAKENETIAIKGGFCLGQLVSEAEVKRLATIPSREELIAMLLRTMNGPISGFVNVCAGPIRGFGNVINAIKDQQGE